MRRRVLRKVRKPWFLLTRFFWWRVFFSFVYFFSSWLSALNGSSPMLRRHIAAVCLATPSADNPLSHRKKRKETDIIKMYLWMRKSPFSSPFTKGGYCFVALFILSAPHPNPLPKKGRGNIKLPFIREVPRMRRRVFRHSAIVPPHASCHPESVEKSVEP